MVKKITVPVKIVVRVCTTCVETAYEEEEEEKLFPRRRRFFASRLVSASSVRSVRPSLVQSSSIAEEEKRLLKLITGAEDTKEAPKRHQ